VPTAVSRIPIISATPLYERIMHNSQILPSSHPNREKSQARLL